jgi:hypothetical protein
MVIQPVGKIICIDTKSIRDTGRSTQGVKFLEPQDKVASISFGIWSHPYLGNGNDV